MSEVMLEVAGLKVRYGPIAALEGVSLTLRRGEAVALLGANGAGKTTMLNILSGFLAPAGGRIDLQGQSIARLPPHAIVRLGVLQVSQDRDLFSDLTVLDNLKLGGLTGASPFAERLGHAFTYFPRLKERQRQPAKTLSGGEQQMLAIARALMAEPRILLLDEPSAGLAPLFLPEIAAILNALKRDQDITILLVEQNIRFAARIADRFLVLRAGRIVAEGQAATLMSDPEAIARQHYL
jgi:branched-chain amino acid transport system ATP-binding protein